MTSAQRLGIIGIRYKILPNTIRMKAICPVINLAHILIFGCGPNVVVLVK